MKLKYMLLFFLIHIASCLERFETPNFYQFYKQQIYPDVLRVGDKPENYFQLPTSENLVKVCEAVTDFVEKFTRPFSFLGASATSWPSGGVRLTCV